MKSKILMALLAIILIGVTGCKQQSNPQQTNQSVATEEQSSEDIVIPEDDSDEQSSGTEDGTLTGLYQFGDSNATWIVQVNKDETARLWKKDDPKNVYYGSWNDIAEDDGEIWLDIDKMSELKIKKTDGDVLDFSEKFGYIVIKGKWLYLDGDACKAKDPGKRIAVKKVK